MGINNQNITRIKRRNKHLFAPRCGNIKEEKEKKKLIHITNLIKPAKARRGEG